MSDRTHISWATSTWNPVSGCTKVSPGCDRCYIDRTPPFRMNGRRFDKPGIGGTTGVILHPDRLLQPFRWREPRLVFVNSLSDLFHEDVPDGFIGDLFDVMAKAKRHTFQILTKRPARMRALLTKWTNEGTLDGERYASEGSSWRPGASWRRTDMQWAQPGADRWPLPNVWLGVSAENQEWADRRVPILLGTPAAVRFVSAEPLLGPIEMRTPHGLDWLIVGGESGPGARPMEPEWAASLLAQCRATGVAFHFKQHGAVTARALGLKHRAGADPSEWPVQWPREYPTHTTAAAAADATFKAAGLAWTEHRKGEQP